MVNSLKTRILLFFFIGFYSQSFGQIERKSLFPIEVKHKFLSTKFIYDRQTIENPLALQIPLLQARDTEVNVEFLTFKKQRKFAQTVSLLTAGFSIYTIFNREKVSDGAYWGTLGGSLLLSGYLNIRSNQHLGKAIKRYNEVVGTNKIGLIFDKSIDNQLITSVGFVHKF
jgi:hypothetical protein